MTIKESAEAAGADLSAVYVRSAEEDWAERRTELRGKTLRAVERKIMARQVREAKARLDLAEKMRKRGEKEFDSAPKAESLSEAAAVAFKAAEMERLEQASFTRLWVDFMMQWMAAMNDAVTCKECRERVKEANADFVSRMTAEGGLGNAVEQGD
jgi:formylmethanofuran dehydrogenase subunit E